VWRADAPATEGWPALTRLAYTGFDAGLTLVLALTIVLQFMRLAGAATPGAGRVVAEQRA
jgi:hypothetical protein